MKQCPFSKLNIPRLERFSAQLANKYPAITRVTLHHSALDEAKYVLVLEVDKDSPPDEMADWSCSDWTHLRHIAWVPEEIRDHEDDWFPWTKEKGDILPGELVIDEGDILYEREKTKGKVKKLRPSQEHKLACRKVAKKVWRKDPEKTIAELSLSDPIAKACGNKIYAEATIRNWIKDLCPNRHPGRRPEKKK